MKKIIEIIAFVNFEKNKHFLIKLEIVVVLLVNIEGQLRKNVILMSHRNKIILYQFYFTISVNMTVISSSKS